MNYFQRAVPVWPEIKEYNVFLQFDAHLPYGGGAASLALAADTFYRLWVNGKFFFYGPQKCGKGWWRVDRLDLTPVLRQGDNLLTIEVANYGVEAFNYVNQPGFLQAEVTVEGKVLLATGENFTCRRNLSKEQVIERYDYQRPFLECWDLPAELSDALPVEQVRGIRLCDRTSPLPEFREATPVRTVFRGHARKPETFDKKPNNRLENCFMEEDGPFCYPLEKLYCYRDMIRQSTVTEEVAVEEPYAPETLEANQFVTFAFDKDDTGFLHLVLDCPEDAELFYTYDEILLDGRLQPENRYDGSACVNRITMKKGRHDFLAFEPLTMQYVRLWCTKGSVRAESVTLKEYVNPEGHKAKFDCDDAALKRIYDAAVTTFEQNAVDVFSDCPCRERAGWLCDSFFTARVERDLTGGSKIEKSFLENFFIATDFPRLPEGMVPMCYPSDTLSGQFIPNWAMFLVIELEEYVQRSGNSEILAMARERLYLLEKYFSTFLNEDGLLEGLKGWVFVEWSQANKWVQDVNFPSNMMYYAMLMSMSRLYGDEALREKAEQIRAAILRLSFNGTFFEDHLVRENGQLVRKGDVTEVCQYYAFFTGVVDKAGFPQLMEIIARDFGAGGKCTETHPEVFPANAFIGNYLRMEVLSANGYRKQIIGEIKEYFDYMAQRTGTLWENDAPTASCNHGFASHVVRFIFRDCLGISGVREETATVFLNKDYCGPANATAVLPLGRGELRVDIRDGIRSVRTTGGYTITE